MSDVQTLQIQLDQVNQAITVILTGGQEYRFNDGQIESMVRRGDLRQLNLMKKELELEIEGLTSPGGFNAF